MARQPAKKGQDMEQALQAQVARILAEEAQDGEFDAALEALDAALAASPQDAALYALRARLHAHGYEYLAAWHDWHQAFRLQPQLRDAGLQAAALQLRWATHIADAELEAQQLRDGSAPAALESADDDDEVLQHVERDDERLYPRINALEQEAAAMLLGLLQEHVSDLAFVQQLLQVWDEAPLWWPCHHQSLLLYARAAHPNDPLLLRLHGLFLTRLARSDIEDDERPLVGFLHDALGALWHVPTLFDARAVLAQATPDHEVLSARAELALALDDYPAAHAIYQELAAWCGQQQGAAEDEEERVYWQDAQQDAEAEAASAAGGRKHFVQSRMSSLQQGMDQLLARLHGEDGQEARLSEMSAGLQGMPQQLSQAMLELEDEPDAPDAQALQDMRQRAQELGQSWCRLLQVHTTRLQPIVAASISAEAQHWFAGLQAECEALGLRLVSHFVNLFYRDELGMDAWGQLWSDDSGIVLVLEYTPRIQLQRFMSQLDDGHFLVVSNALELGGFGHGPRVDSLRVAQQTPLAQMLTLQRARCHFHHATQGGKPQPLGELEQLAALEDAMQHQVNLFRWQSGFSEAEMHGFHQRFYAPFAEMLQQEVAQQRARLRAQGISFDA